MSQISGIQRLLDDVLNGRFPSELRKRQQRKLQLEALEQRLPMAASIPVPNDPIEMPRDELAVVSEEATMPAADERVDITRVVLTINGRDRAFNRTERSVFLRAGDTVEVKEIEYDVAPAAQGLEGVIAAEAYLRREGEWGYEDGRFGDNQSSFQQSTESVVVGDAWTVAATDDRMSLVLLHYHGDQADVIGRFFINLRVRPADLFIYNVGQTISGLRNLKVGDDAKFDTSWGTTSHTPLDAEIEVSVFLQGSQSALWSGRASGEAIAGRPFRGEVTDNGESWTPTRAGHYLVVLQLDPDDHHSELTEHNNRFAFRVSVGEGKRPASSARDSLFGSGSRFWDD